MQNYINVCTCQPWSSRCLAAISFFPVSRLNTKPVYYTIQYCGSRSTWIRIGSALLDLGSVLGMRIRIQEQEKLTKLTNKSEFQPFKKPFVPKYKFYDLLLP
jgi:hypothetical protein